MLIAAEAWSRVDVGAAPVLGAPSPDRRTARALPAADMSRKPDSPNSGPDPFGAPEFQPEQTHRIALWSEHRLLADSRGRGWREVYTSLAAEQPWTRRLEALPHVALAYCTHRPARVSRRIEGDGPGAARQAELRPRLFGMIPSDRDSHWSLHGTPDIQLVYLHRRLIDRIAAEAFGLDPARVEWTFGLGFADPLLEQLCLSLLDVARREDHGTGALFADSIGQLLALHLLRNYTARPVARLASQQPRAVAPGRMSHVCDFIESALDDDLSLPRLAAEAGLSAHTFAPAFKRAMGITVHGYVLQRRIERAKRLLRQGDMPVLDVALSAGFASQSHLAAAFKRATGSTPSAYRG